MERAEEGVEGKAAQQRGENQTLPRVRYGAGLLRTLRVPKSFSLYGSCLSIFSILNIKTDKVSIN